MTDKVLCPWCGSEIWWPREPWLKGNPYTGDSCYKMQGKCRECDAMTPAAYGRTSEETVEKFFAALRRYEPPVRPLTLDEALERCIVYIEYRIYDEVQSDPILLHYIWDEWSEETILAYQMFGLLGENTDIDHPNDYGHTWRCWPRKPTDEERKENKWHEE